MCAPGQEQTIVMPDGELRRICPHLRVNPITCTVRRTDLVPPPKKPTALIPPKPKGVTPQKPKEEPKPKKVREPRPKATQRPGGRATTTPAPPRVSRPRPARTHSAGRPWTPAIAIAAAVLFVAGLVGKTAVAIAATVGLALTVFGAVALLLIIAVPVGVAVTEDLGPRLVGHLERRRRPRAEFAARRDAAIAQATAPIVLGPATTPVTKELEPVTETVTASEHTELMRRWTPGTHVPDLAPEWRRKTR